MRIASYSNTIPATFNGKNFKLAISLVQSHIKNSEKFEINSFLSTDEKARLNSIHNNKSRHEFLSGRLAAKIALKKLDEKPNMPDITIASGIFGQPIFIGRNLKPFELSISHSQDYTVAFIAPPGYPIGIDIELLNRNNIAELNSLALKRELKKIQLVCAEDDLRLATRIWGLKESLSKAIKCGFTIPLGLYELEGIEDDGDNIHYNFLNFQQYSALSTCFNDIYISITIPKLVKIQINIDYFIKNLCETLSCDEYKILSLNQFGDTKLK